MEKEIYIKKGWLFIPVCATYGELPFGGKKNNRMLEIFCREDNSETKLFEFQIPAGEAEDETYPVSYYARFPVKQFTDKTLILRGDLRKAFFDGIRNEDVPETEEKSLRATQGEAFRRPSIHFTPQTGWMNDPNGLVYAEGVYHLYFQHNPFDVQWENMSWGHAVSRDLLHWEQKDDVLFPDETGTMFSGSGIVNDRKMLGLPEDAVIFFYTAAGNNNKWSAGKQFTQRIAYSTDGGETLHKIDKGVLPTVCKENRDPKVFWHEKSGAYIMTLWLEENDFGIFRSTDLLKWEQTDRLTFKEAWECPDLVCLKDEKGNETWMFWSADGFYFWGEFDGYQFQTDGVRHAAYINKIAYAAQTYSNTGNRVISVPWLRFPNRGRNYTGAMGLPREFSVAYKNGEKVLRQEPVREYENSKKLVYDSTENTFQWKFGQDTATEIQITRAQSEDILSARINQKFNVVYNAKTGELKAGEETVSIGAGIRDFSLLFDDVILEVTADCGTIIGIFELPEVAEKFCVEKGSIEKIQVFGEEVWQP